MGITPQFRNGYVKEVVDKYHDRIVQASLVVLQAFLEELIVFAKDRRNYTDQTGNLTNSIGGVITYNGKIVHQAGFTGDGDEGAQVGIKFANDIASKTKSNISLIVVAGMNYAAYVEAKGYNVILPAELMAKQQMKDRLNGLKKSLNKIYGI